MFNEILFVTFLFLTRVVFPLTLTLLLGILLKHALEPKILTPAA